MAKKRYVDGAAMSLTDVYTGKTYVSSLTEQLASSLVIELKDMEVLALFRESPSVVAERNGLIEKQKRLKDAERRLNSGIAGIQILGQC